MTHLRQRTAAALVTGWLVACSSIGAIAHPTSANEFNSMGSCADLGNSVAEGVWQWCAKNEEKNMNGCKARFRSWPPEVEGKCSAERRKHRCSPSEYDAVQWHMHGWKRPGQKLSLHYAVHSCEEGTQGQAAGSGAGGAAPTLDREARRRMQTALAAQGFDPGQADGKFGPRTRGAIQGLAAGRTATPRPESSRASRPSGLLAAESPWQQANGHAATRELTGEQAERLLPAESPPGAADTAATGKPHGSSALSNLGFSCDGGRAELEELKWDVQNYQNFDQEYKASTHLLLAYCQMALGDPRGALENFQVASDMGTINANFWLANYFLTGG